MYGQRWRVRCINRLGRLVITQWKTKFFFTLISCRQCTLLKSQKLEFVVDWPPSLFCSRTNTSNSPGDDDVAPISLILTSLMMFSSFSFFRLHLCNFCRLRQPSLHRQRLDKTFATAEELCSSSLMEKLLHRPSLAPLVFKGILHLIRATSRFGGRAQRIVTFKIYLFFSNKKCEIV